MFSNLAAAIGTQKYDVYDIIRENSVMFKILNIAHMRYHLHQDAPSITSNYETI